MSLIIRNKSTLGETAIIFLKHLNGKIETVTSGDFTIIKVNNEIIGINVFNSYKYFRHIDGPKTLTDNEIKILKNNLNENIEFSSSFKVGEIITRAIHPNSKKLILLKVKTDREINIVTNAKNALVGKKVIVGQVNSVLPSGLPILKSKILGEKSEGMLCGGETLGLVKTTGVKIIEGNTGDEFIL